ncbi:hypothetical protein GJ496_009858 [Pomphorhynchus laevis]|nr:hypothetical protein GJ496_009858 [Pomphorhynchus laevis]
MMMLLMMKAITELLSIALGCFLIFYGSSKVTPNFTPNFHETLKGEFGKLNRAFPFYDLTQFRPYARTYRCVFGLAEIIGGSFLIGGKACIQRISAMILFSMHSLVLYSLYAISEPFNEKYYVEGSLVTALFFVYTLMSFASGKKCCNRTTAVNRTSSTSSCSSRRRHMSEGRYSNGDSDISESGSNSEHHESPSSKKGHNKIRARQQIHTGE